MCIVGLQVILEAVAVHLGIHLRHIAGAGAGAEADPDLTPLTTVIVSIHMEGAEADPDLIPLTTVVVGIHMEGGAEADHTLLTTVGTDLHTTPATDAGRHTLAHVLHMAGHQ